ncbi:MAG TPA: hypothetical protein VHD90_06340 [Phototrophicaceae bacterium]|nr:hypothetical protein [Phototrophicaceae bacterium]
MLADVRRYVRAFVLALRFTLRGEQPPLLKVREAYPQLAAWWAQTISLIRAIERTAAANHVSLETVKLHVDRREQNAATVLATIRFHAERDYPYLLVHDAQYGQMTLQATNLNDRHLVAKLLETVDPSLKASVQALDDHLALLPIQSNSEV